MCAFTGSPASELRDAASSIFGLNNPTLASSEAAGHSASLGNDGNASDFLAGAGR
jgi:hypothetical protein